MNAFVVAGTGFLLAVLWFDLIFDVQVLGGRDEPDAVDSISSYYARVTTAARPMNLLIGAVMAATLAAIVVEIAKEEDPVWLGWVSLGLAGTAIGVALGRTFPGAVRLGEGGGSAKERLELARSIGRDHVLCLGAIATVTAIQLGFG